MAKMLKDLFYGDLSLSDRSMPKGSAMHKLSTKLCKCEETLEELLDEEGKEQLKALTRPSGRWTASPPRRTSSWVSAWASG